MGNQRMKVLLCIVSRIVFVFSMCAASLVLAGPDSRAHIPVYKGGLEFFVHEHASRSVLRIQFSSRTREVLRIAIEDAVLIHSVTGDVTRLRPKMAVLSSRVDRAGYWVAEIVYRDLELIGNDYRLSGRLMQYLANAKRSRRFDVYLGVKPISRPPASSIDWGLQQ